MTAGLKPAALYVSCPCGTTASSPLHHIPAMPCHRCSLPDCGELPFVPRHPRFSTLHLAAAVERAFSAKIGPSNDYRDYLMLMQSKTTEFVMWVRRKNRLFFSCDAHSGVMMCATVNSGALSACPPKSNLSLGYLCQCPSAAGG